MVLISLPIPAASAASAWVPSCLEISSDKQISPVALNVNTQVLRILAEWSQILGHTATWIASILAPDRVLVPPGNLLLSLYCPHSSQQSASKVLLDWPINLCFQHWTAFLAQSSNLFHVPPTKQFKRPKSHAVRFIITMASPLSTNSCLKFVPCYYDKFTSVKYQDFSEFSFTLCEDVSQGLV